MRYGESQEEVRGLGLGLGVQPLRGGLWRSGVYTGGGIEPSALSWPGESVASS